MGVSQVRVCLLSQIRDKGCLTIASGSEKCSGTDCTGSGGKHIGTIASIKLDNTLFVLAFLRHSFIERGCQIKAQHGQFLLLCLCPGRPFSFASISLCLSIKSDDMKTANAQLLQFGSRPFLSKAESMYRNRISNPPHYTRLENTGKIDIGSHPAPYNGSQNGRGEGIYCEAR